MFKENRQEKDLMGISLSGVMMKAFYKNQEIILLDKSADLVLIVFVSSGKTMWVKEELIRFSY